ncbi:co-chaperone GroES [Fructobacillus fructosus]|uniref:co-chaperone GroES n=1 Tax=Fructobacillus fructosus TaxID=1631 RepID=UPI00021955DB|nr:co-chaperone GroES [Fructobacillus fructosus]MBD9366527.1 co-chaperone GroES [Leuconostoc mesenteroides]MCH9869441.1 co-chaperone GroES [Serratia marcescens]KRN52936.1 co-chaperonin GroES [Fructobacillus fructosus KCTC 3544]MBC9119239.1 co-chaperone GroES [Fructobacillus fructosus]CAK1242807.1 Co-chaperonin GroES (HSP10) (GroES) [Fructobacillus fructosus]
MLKPLSDRLIVSVEEAGEQQVGGIVIAQAAQEKPVTGKVVAAGPGRVTDAGQTIAMTVKAGDTVLFDKFAGQAIEVDGQNLLALHEKDVIGVLA